MDRPPIPREARTATSGELLAFERAFRELLATAYKACELRLPATSDPLCHKEVQEMGLDEDLVRALLYYDYLEHFRWAPRNTGRAVRVVLADSLVFTEASCFMLTEKGKAFAKQLLAAAAGDKRAAGAVRRQLLLGRFVPQYHVPDRVFRWGCHVLKCFRQPAGNQLLLLAAAEELGWPEWFDDPLPPVAGHSSKVRLHDTIKDLNRRQRRRLIHFNGDGSGTRVGWELR
jgi:hypothetical protein